MELKKARERLLILVIFIIAFPMLQQNFKFFSSGDLKGAITLAANPDFDWGKWWDGTYQRQKAAYLNDNTGCRPDLVRLTNQIDFWLFHKLHANGVVIGKENYLFEQPYIDEYNGQDFLGDSAIRSKIIMLKKIQDALERLGKTVIYVHAPSKAWYYPDKFPQSTGHRMRHDTTNYTTFRRLADSAGIHQVDFNNWFLTLKDTIRHLLYSRQGTHWTTYGSLLAEDSLIKYIEHHRSIRMPELHWDSVEYSSLHRLYDADLAEGANLIMQYTTEQFSYPVYHYDHDTGLVMPRTIYIGDSYLWVWAANRMMQNISTTWQFWYYFKEVYSDSTFKPGSVQQLDNIDWGKELKNTDCLIMLYNPANIKRLNSNEDFIDKVYRYFYPYLTTPTALRSSHSLSP